MKKNFRFYVALWGAKAGTILLKLLRRNATFFPGKFAITVCPDFIARIDKPKTVIAVTGTNGKTTVCNMIEDVLKDNNNIEYELVLFGDVDKNGSVCTAGDLYTVKKALLSLENNKNFDKLQRLAADVQYQTKSDGAVLLDRNGLTVLNAFDLSRMRLKALGYDGHYNIESDRLSGTLIYESIYRYSE